MIKKILVVLAGLAALSVLATADGPTWSWREAGVDPRGEHVALFYGSGDDDPESWALVARVGPPRGRSFPVQWLVDPKAVANQEMAEIVKEDLDYYLTDLGRPDPWAYAQYHCRTTINMYSRVHWWCVEPEPPTTRVAGK